VQRVKAAMAGRVKSITKPGRGAADPITPISTGILTTLPPPSRMFTSRPLWVFGVIVGRIRQRRTLDREILAMSFVQCAALVASGLLLSAASAFAGPMYTFSTSQGVQLSNVGTVTLTQVPIARPWTCSSTWPIPPRRCRPMGFLTSADRIRRLRSPWRAPKMVSASFIQPPGGTYAFGMFSLSTANGGATPYGTFGISMTQRGAARVTPTTATWSSTSPGLAVSAPMTLLRTRRSIPAVPVRHTSLRTSPTVAATRARRRG